MDARSPLKCILKWLIFWDLNRTKSPHRNSNRIPGSIKHRSPPSQFSDKTRTRHSWSSAQSRWILVETLKLITKPPKGYAGEKPSAGNTSAYWERIEYSLGRSSLSYMKYVSKLPKECCVENEYLQHHEATQKSLESNFEWEYILPYTFEVPLTCGEDTER